MLGIPVTDTLKQVDSDGNVAETLEKRTSSGRHRHPRCLTIIC